MVRTCEALGRPHATRTPRSCPDVDREYEGGVGLLSATALWGWRRRGHARDGRSHGGVCVEGDRDCGPLGLVGAHVCGAVAGVLRRLEPGAVATLGRNRHALLERAVFTTMTL